MQLTCPTCGATYDVPNAAIGAKGRKVRCRACGGSWHQPGTETPRPAPPAPAPAAPIAEAPEAAPPVRKASRRGPWLLLALVAVVLALGVVAAVLAFGPQQVASRLGIDRSRVPLGIAITREPDWRLIAGGSQLFAVSGRIWNPTSAEQSVPDIRAELKDRQGRTVYAWTITRPVPRLAPGQSASFDGAAVDVPAESANVSLSFAGSEDR